jgi:lipopolysaccharide transport system permease protein
LNSTAKKEIWDWELRPESFWFHWDFKQVWRYRHLLFRLVRRDFLIHHQQTLLGPLWIVFQPLVMLLTYIVIFQRAVGLPTDDLPPVLFYFSGIVVWNLFSECFTGTAFTFLHNSHLFGKVYFPRLVIPLSVVLVNLVRFAIQLAVFLLVLLYYYFYEGFHLDPVSWTPTLLVVTVITSGTGLGLGLLFSILTAKYRDLVNIIHLSVRLLMFATPVIYPLSMVEPGIRKWVSMNPISPCVEFFRFSFLGKGTVNEMQLMYALICMVTLLLIGTLFFNKFGNKLQDVI